MSALPWGARLCLSAVIAAGVAVVVVMAPRATFDQPGLFLALLGIAGVTSGFRMSVPLDRRGAVMPVAYVVDFTALLLVGPHQAMLIAVAGAWCRATLRVSEKPPTFRTLYGMARLVIAVQAAGAVYLWLGGAPGEFAGPLDSLARSLAGAAAAFFALNTGLIALAIGLSRRQSVLAVWNEDAGMRAPGYVIGTGVAAAAAWAVVTWGGWLMLLAILPLYLASGVYRFYVGRIDAERRHVQEMADLHLATIEALALAIDAKDRTAQSHLRRVQVYAAALARGLGMSDRDVQGVKTAALLHDIGKLAVPEYILSKPGPLTQEEFQKVRSHPRVGAEIISAVPFPYPVAPLILSHHERWDGKGYPEGLKGEAIPLGARILSVVDFYDALTSDRPYHRGIAQEAALALLQQEAGHALDPAVVQMFVEILPALGGEVPEEDDSPARRLFLEPGADRGRPAVGFAHEGGKGNTVFEDIAHAHREIYALYEIAQTMGTSLGVADTMGVISSKLANLVPFSACALFLYNEEDDTLHCRFVTGAEHDAVSAITMRSGQGLTGWVARNRRPLVNARPSADFEAAGLTGHATCLQAAIVAPLLFGDRFIGTLAVYHHEPEFYSDDHRRLLDRVCEQAAAVIHNSVVFEQTQEDSLTDPLTELPNTRFMFMYLTRELARAGRLRGEVALLVMDLDNFKEINDTYGHHVGDRALREVAAALRATIRPYDICVRYAGDEFIVVLPGCGSDEAERKRQELQRAVDDLVFEARPDRRLPIAVSVGMAIYPHDGESYESLLATADSRMYRDKASRRQRVRSAGEATGAAPSAPASPAPTSEISEIDIQRAGTGVL